MREDDFGMTAHYWNGDVACLLGRVWSRKYNGFSVIWDGGVTTGMNADRIPWYHRGGDKEVPVSTGLWSLGRNGVVKVIHAPKSWTDLLPKGIPLHGELWFNDNTEYLKTHVKRKQANTMYWNPIKFKVFYVKPYETFPLIHTIVDDIRKSQFFSNEHSQGKYLMMAEGLNVTNRVVSFVEHNPCNSKQQVLELIEDFNKGTLFGDGKPWEGIMFFDPSTKYEGKRSYASLKYKPSFEDEAVITGYEEGKTGARLGKVGTILADYTVTEKCQYLCGFKPEFVGKTVQVRVSGLNQTEQEWDMCKQIYPIGSLITFGYKMFSEHGVPQSSNIYREM
jgi:hypothetical protein